MVGSDFGMSTINATIDVGDDSAGVIAGLLTGFPKGRRVRVAVSEDPEPGYFIVPLESRSVRPCSAGFQTCCVADFKVGRASVSPSGRRV